MKENTTKPEQTTKFKPDDRVKLIRYDGDEDPVDFGASGFVIQLTIGRFGPYVKDTFYYFGSIEEFPEWCVISTTMNVTSTTKHYAVRKDRIKLLNHGTKES